MTQNDTKTLTLLMTLMLCTLNQFAWSQDETSICADTLENFTLLGAFNNNKYYLSDYTSTWQDASAAAEALNGYLASINSQEENDFIQAQLGETIAFIGYNDASTEGEFVWDSGETVEFENLASDNDEDRDYAAMNFWAGTWKLEKGTVNKRFVLEMNCPLMEPDGCYEFLGQGGLNCVENDSSGRLHLTYGENDNYITVILNDMGQVISAQPANLPDPSPTFRVEDGHLEKLLDTTVIYSLRIPVAISFAYHHIVGFVELGDKYILLERRGLAPYDLVGILTDNDLNVEQTAVLENFNSLGSPTVKSIRQIDDDTFAFITESSNYNLTHKLLVVNKDLEVLYSTQVQRVDFGWSGLNKNSCGQFILGNGYLNESYNYYNTGSVRRHGYFEDGRFVRKHVSSYRKVSDWGQVTKNYSWTLSLPDTCSINVKNIYDNYLGVVKKQGNTVIWDKYIELPNFNHLRRIALSGDELLFISSSNDSIFVQTLSCLEIVDAKPDLFIRNGRANAIVNGSASSGNIIAGNDLYITSYLRNLGLATAPSFKVTYFLSADTIYSPNTDIELGENIFPSITPNDYSNSSILPNQFTMPDSVPSGDYYIIMIADVENLVPEENEDNNMYFKSISVTGSDHVDLEMEILAEDFNIYSYVPFQVRLTNTGTVNAEDVVVDFPFPDDFVYSESMTSRGSYHSFHERWDVGIVEVGETVVLDLILYALSNNTTTAYAQVASAHPDDVDSTPDNGTCCTPNEDDEAAITISSNFQNDNGTSALSIPTANRDLEIKALYPNIVTNEMSIFVQSKLPTLLLRVYNLQGQEVMQQNYQNTEGFQRLDLEVSDLPAGVYLIRFDGTLGQETTKFIKLRM